MLIALEVAKNKVKFRTLVFFFTHDDFLDHIKPVDCWQHRPQVSVLHRFDPVDVIRHDCDHLLLECSHVSEGAVIHQIDSVVILHKDRTRGLVSPQEINPSEESRCFSVAGILFLVELEFLRNFLTLERLSESDVELR